jgi:hypothetical protein
MSVSQRFYLKGSAVAGCLLFCLLLDALFKFNSITSTLVAVITLGWVPVSAVVLIVSAFFRPSIALAFLSLSYLLMFILNYLFGPEMQLNTSLDTATISTIIYGAIYASVSIWLLKREQKHQAVNRVSNIG